MLKSERVLSSTLNVMLTCEQRLKHYFPKVSMPPQVVDTVSGTLILTNYRFVFKLVNSYLLNIPVHYISALEYDEQQLLLSFFFKLKLVLNGNLDHFVATIYGLLSTRINNLTVPVLEQPYNGAGKDLFDPFKEFERQKVIVENPTIQELSAMVFGQTVNPQLLFYLLNSKPMYSEEFYTKTSEELIKLNNIEDVPFATFEFDRRSLFESDEEFYSLLAKHPENSPDFLANYAEQQEQLDAELKLDEELSNSSDTSSEVSQESEISTLFRKVVESVKKAISEQQGASSQQPPQEFSFQANHYAHGCFFAPSYFMQTPGRRQELKTFIELCNEGKLPAVHSGEASHGRFRVSYANANYAISPTYPSVLAVPVSDELLMQAVKFRSRGRVPALSYRCEHACLTRCAQPGSGFGISRDSADEQLLNYSRGSDQAPLLVFDARPKLAAFGNVLEGKGFENRVNYPFTQTYYCNIENIHAVRRSWEGVLAAREFSFDNVQKSGWFTHLQLLLYSAAQIARLMHAGVSVLVHCTDGWDRTSQLTSLAMLSLDGFYRTTRGFLLLMQKEWLSFGHQFATRCRLPGSAKASRRKEKEYFTYNSNDLVGGGIGRRVCKDEVLCDNNIVESYSAPIQSIFDAQLVSLPVPKQDEFKFSASQTAPIFFEFLDAVAELIMQRPEAFEFSVALLVSLARELYGARYGDFFYDSERCRTESNAFARLDSCFDALLAERDAYACPAYDAREPLEIAWGSMDFGVVEELWRLQ